jgi:hypothetical protein
MTPEEEQRKQLARKVAERWLTNPEVLEDLENSLQEEPVEWTDEKRRTDGEETKG